MPTDLRQRVSRRIANQWNCGQWFVHLQFHDEAVNDAKNGECCRGLASPLGYVDPSDYPVSIALQSFPASGCLVVGTVNIVLSFVFVISIRTPKVRRSSAHDLNQP